MRKITLSIVATLTTFACLSVNAAQTGEAKAVQVLRTLPQPVFGSSGGDPVEVRTAPYHSNLVFQSGTRDVLDLASVPRLALRAKQRIKRIEVRAAGTGAIVASINGQRVSEVVQLNDMYEFQTYGLKIDRIIEAQDPLQVKVEVVEGEVRFMDLSVLMLKPIGSDQSALGAAGNIGKSTCDLQPSIMSHSWTLQKGGNVVKYESPVLLFNAIEKSCKPMRFLCYVSETESGGKFAISVNIRGEIHNKTGAMGLEQATKELEKLQKTGFCAY